MCISRWDLTNSIIKTRAGSFKTARIGYSETGVSEGIFPDIGERRGRSDTAELQPLPCPPAIWCHQFPQGALLSNARLSCQAALPGLFWSCVQVACGEGRGSVAGSRLAGFLVKGNYRKYMVSLENEAVYGLHQLRVRGGI